MRENLNNIGVDIIMPNYNSYPFIEETIQSIIKQSFQNWKLNIVDASSDNETQKILKKYSDHPNINIIWLKKNKKAGFCRNLAIRKSKLEYIGFLDSDDIWDSNKVLKQLSFMLKNNYQFSYTNYTAFKNKKNKVIIRKINPPKKFDFDSFIKNTSIGTSTMIAKRSLIQNIKFSRTRICEDYFFKCQILKKIKFAYCLDENLTKYRIRKNSLQSNKLRNLYWIWNINRNYNRLSFVKNFISIMFISINSFKKYGFK